MAEKDGGSAFPQVQSDQDGSSGDNYPNFYSTGGMTLRDYFAAKAMQGDWASQDAETGTWDSEHSPGSALAMKDRAALYYRMADLMLAARSASKHLS